MVSKESECWEGSSDDLMMLVGARWGFVLRLLCSWMLAVVLVVDEDEMMYDGSGDDSSSYKLKWDDDKQKNESRGRFGSS